MCFTDEIQIKAERFPNHKLPAHLQEIASPFWELARTLATKGKANRETLLALDRLMEAKDAAVRGHFGGGRSELEEAKLLIKDVAKGGYSERVTWKEDYVRIDNSNDDIAERGGYWTLTISDETVCVDHRTRAVPLFEHGQTRLGWFRTILSMHTA